MSDGTQHRAGLGEHTAASRRVLLTPRSPRAVEILTPRLRISAAARAAELAGQPRLAAEYRAMAPAAPRVDPDSAPSLTSAVHDFTDRVTLAPGLAGPDVLRGLTAQGLDAPAVVALAQICAFVSYEARVVSGLALLAGHPAAETTHIPAPPPAAPHAPGAERLTLDELTWRPRISSVDAAALTAEQQAVIDAHTTLSVTSPYYRTLLHDPAALDHRTHVYNAVMYGRGGLPRAERELATLLVSRANGCVYCASVHGRKYAQLSRDQAAAQRVLSEGGDGLAADDARGRAIARFAEAQTRTPPRGSAEDVHALRAAGLDEAELTDLVHAVALFGWANRLMLVLGDAHPVRQPDSDIPRNDARESCSQTSGRASRAGDA
ncbi:peroxidase-related enzyme [Streptomyces sp. NPDC050428]|uniref:peroxidase-related enzyme n=1 Tax=Streptomyces sp. NPDC050428 TaxID=3155757 RepID=UPI0034390864